MIERLRRPLESLIQENHAFFKTVCRFHNVSPVLSAQKSPRHSRGLVLGLVVCSVKECHHLGSVAGGTGAEVGGIEAIGDAIFHRPEDGFIEEVRLLHIGEGILVGGGYGRTGRINDHLRLRKNRI